MKIILNRTSAGYWVMEMDGLPMGIPLCIGPDVVQAYGDVVWLKDEFMQRAQVQQ